MPTIAISPLVFAFAQTLKLAGVPKRFIPLLCAFLGVGFGVAINGTTVWAAVEGLASGLAAVGLYEGYKQATS